MFLQLRCRGKSNSVIKNLTNWTPISGSLIVLIITALIILPVFLTQLIPLNDYPFHLARIVILSDLDHPVYSEFYKQGSFLLPNMAMDMIAIPLASFVGAETASRIFVMLSLLSMLFGTMMLHYAAHKRFSPWPLLAVVFLFNGIFRYGFLNYIFGMGVAFFAAGLWLWMKPGYFRILVALIFSLLLVLLHFAAFGIFAIIVGSIEIHAASTSWRKLGLKVSIRRLFLSAAPFLMTIALFMLLSPTAEVANNGWNYPNYLGAKPYGALYSLLTGITWLDIISISSILILPIFLLFARRINIASNIMSAMLMMMIAFIVLPGSLMGSAFVYVRLGPAIALLWIAAIDVKAADINANRLIVILVILLSVLTSSGITSQWHDFNQKTSEIVSVFDKTETGATIFSATAQPYTLLIADTPERRFAWNPPLKHIGSYAVLYGPKFVPMTFVDPMKQPLNVAEKYQDVKAFQGNNPRKTYSGPELEQFLLEIRAHLSDGNWPPLDNVYVFVMGFDRIKDDFNPSILKGWAHVSESGDDYVLIKYN